MMPQDIKEIQSFLTGERELIISKVSENSSKTIVDLIFQILDADLNVKFEQLSREIEKR